VAHKVDVEVTKDADRGEPLAQLWRGKIERKTVKRAVMTTPYGVTAKGIGRQLLEDGFTDGMGEESTPAADYLRDLIIPALEEAAGNAKQIMAWLQSVAEALAKHDIPFRWKTKTGNTVEQAYWDLIEHRVQSLVGQTTLYREEPSSGLRKRKQCASAAPNVVHSFDASHLCRVVNACAQIGLFDFAVVHDSFGVHAANTARLGDILRDEFAKIYEETNWLQEIEAYVREYAPKVEIPSWSKFVTLGDLKLFPAVLVSRYAFD
jgi:DNA-directed RNA polymerase